MPNAQKYAILQINMERFIGYFHSSGTSASQSKATGACRAARKRGWSILRFDLRSVAQVRADLGYWKPDGCIVDAVAARPDLLRLREFSQLPTVFIDDNLRTSRKGVSTLVQDADRIAEEAADELLRHNLASYAFASWPDRRFWNTSREKAFLRALDRRHVKPSVFRLAISNRNRPSVVTELAKWIGTLPLPAGIFTACDPMSEQILEAARANALDVPNDLMVIGVDKVGHRGGNCGLDDDGFDLIVEDGSQLGHAGGERTVGASAVGFGVDS